MIEGKGVVVFHPGLQHAHQLALALYEAGMLQQFISGVPVRSSEEPAPVWIPANLAVRMKKVEIPLKLRSHPSIWWLLTQIASRIPDAGMAHDCVHRVMHAFDRWAANEVRRLKPKAVVAFENAACHTFIAAKDVGAKCILDAPSFNHGTSARLIRFSTRGYLTEINRIKDREIELADLVLTCSELARQSYLDAGVSSHKIKAMLLGASFPEGLNSNQNEPRKMRFVFAGVMRYLKSIDLIFDALETLLADGVELELVILGGSDNKKWLERARSIPCVQYLGKKSQRELYEVFSRSDCLLLPSRFDSFGMVVAEAMASGMPAIVSTMTGARALIEAEPDSGWIVPPNLEGILGGMRSALASASNWQVHRNAALRAAAKFTWAAYRERVANAIKEEML